MSTTEHVDEEIFGEDPLQLVGEDLLKMSEEEIKLRYIAGRTQSTKSVGINKSKSIYYWH